MSDRDRYFENELPDFTSEGQAAEVHEAPTGSELDEARKRAKQSPLSNLLSVPYIEVSNRLKEAALTLKDSVIRETWLSRKAKDLSLYTGLLGTAFLLFKSFQVTKNENDLKLSSEIIEDCALNSRNDRTVTFMIGSGGVYALGAVVAKYSNDITKMNEYLRHFKNIDLSPDLPYELLYGRAGYLWACSFLNKHIDGAISASFQRSIVDEIMEAGRRFKNKGQSPLMYEWHGKKYWGAAHGLVGIMHVLMDMELTKEETKNVKDTLRYMINNRFPSGNFPSSEGSTTDKLVHWCHGAPGFVLTLVKAAEVFGDEEFVLAAKDAGEVVWRRGLLKRVGVCHGISGNTYSFLALYRVTREEKFLHRAKAFSVFLEDEALKLISQGKMHGGDRPYSLFEGLGGLSYLFLDMLDPLKAAFPAYEL